MPQSSETSDFVLMHTNYGLLCFSNILGGHGHPWRLSSVIWGGGEGCSLPCHHMLLLKSMWSAIFS